MDIKKSPFLQDVVVNTISLLYKGFFHRVNCPFNRITTGTSKVNVSPVAYERSLAYYATQLNRELRTQVSDTSKSAS